MRRQWVEPPSPLLVTAWGQSANADNATGVTQTVMDWYTAGGGQAANYAIRIGKMASDLFAPRQTQLA